MGDAAMNGLSDRGSIPLSSITQTPVCIDIYMVRVNEYFLNVSLDDAFLLLRAFFFYIYIISQKLHNEFPGWCDYFPKFYF